MGKLWFLVLLLTYYLSIHILDFFLIFCHVTEIAQQAAQIKMRRKLEKQAMAQATKEAKKQQGKQLLSNQIPL